MNKTGLKARGFRVEALGVRSVSRLFVWLLAFLGSRCADKTQKQPALNVNMRPAPHVTNLQRR